MHRHRIRRLMVEAYRLNKQTLYAAVPQGTQIHLFLIFTDQKMPDYETVKNGVVKGIDKLVMAIGIENTVRKNREDGAPE